MLITGCDLWHLILASGQQHLKHARLVWTESPLSSGCSAGAGEPNAAAAAAAAAAADGGNGLVESQSQLLVPVAPNCLDALSNRCPGSMLHCMAHVLRRHA